HMMEASRAQVCKTGPKEPAHPKVSHARPAIKRAQKNRSECGAVRLGSSGLHTRSLNLQRHRKYRRLEFSCQISYYCCKILGTNNTQLIDCIDSEVRPVCSCA